MGWSELHAVVLGRACERLLGHAQHGAMAFIRCLPSTVVEIFSPPIAVSTTLSTSPTLIPYRATASGFT